jgi:hypothetical protein
LRWSLSPSVGTRVVGWQPIGALEHAGATQYLIGRVTQRTVAVALRGDLVLSPRLVVQLYARPFATTGRYDRFQALVAPRAGSPAARFRSLADGVVVDPARDLLEVDVDGDGVVDGVLPLPAGEDRSLDVSAVLRWEYRPGSNLLVAWSQRRSGSTLGADRSPASAFGSLDGDPATSVAIVKLSFRLGH